MDRRDRQISIVATAGQMRGATFIRPPASHHHRTTATDPAVSHKKMNATVPADRNTVAAVDRARTINPVPCAAPDDLLSDVDMVRAGVLTAVTARIQGPDPHGVRVAVQDVRNAVPAIEVTLVVVPISNAGAPVRTRNPARIAMTVHHVLQADQVPVSAQMRTAAADRRLSVVLVVDHRRSEVLAVIVLRLSEDAADRTHRTIEMGRQVAGNVRTTTMTRTKIATRPLLRSLEYSVDQQPHRRA